MASQSSLESRLRERNEIRKAAVEQRRAEREAGQRQEETADYYIQEFARKKAAIVELLESAGTLPKGQLTVHFDHVSEELQNLKKFVSDSTVFLTSFDLKSSQRVSQYSLMINQSVCGMHNYSLGLQLASPRPLLGVINMGEGPETTMLLSLLSQQMMYLMCTFYM